MTTAADSILAVIKAAVPATVGVYDALVPGVPPSRYVVAYIPGGMRMAAAIDAVSDCYYVEFQVTTVASDSNPTYSSVYCRWLANTVRDALTDTYINADGWSPARIRHEGSQSPQPDEATPDKKVYSTDQFSFETVRTS